MEIILTHQTTARNKSDIIVIDSVPTAFTGTAEQKQAICTLNNKEAKRNPGLLKFLQPHASRSLSIRVGKETKSIYIISHFLSKDEDGRKIPFRFWMKESRNPASVHKTLEKQARAVNMELNPSDGLAIEICLSLYPKLKVGLMVGAIILLIIVVKIIFKSIA